MTYNTNQNTCVIAAWSIQRYRIFTLLNIKLKGHYSILQI
jgi:hypothetical protein